MKTLAISVREESRSRVASAMNLIDDVLPWVAQHRTGIVLDNRRGVYGAGRRPSHSLIRCCRVDGRGNSPKQPLGRAEVPPRE
jgi:hypothetical protein